MKRLEELKIKQSVLKAVRKISGAAFSEKLGDEYNIQLDVIKDISIISMYATRCGEAIKCFSFSVSKLYTWQATFPNNLADIKRFESEVETALAEIFEFIKSNK